MGIENDIVNEYGRAYWESNKHDILERANINRNLNTDHVHPNAYERRLLLREHEREEEEEDDDEDEDVEEELTEKEEELISAQSQEQEAPEEPMVPIASVLSRVASFFKRLFPW